MSAGKDDALTWSKTRRDIKSITRGHAGKQRSGCPFHTTTISILLFSFIINIATSFLYTNIRCWNVKLSKHIFTTSCLFSVRNVNAVEELQHKRPLQWRQCNRRRRYHNQTYQVTFCKRWLSIKKKSKNSYAIT